MVAKKSTPKAPKPKPGVKIACDGGSVTLSARSGRFSARKDNGEKSYFDTQDQACKWLKE